MTDATIHIITSELVSVSMEVEPKSVEHTSPDTLDETENTLSIRYPTAIEPTESIAIAASPLSLVLFPVLSKSTAHTMVTGIIKD